ncbi:ABC transporter substrate-binding protein [Rudaeicoccus suwonensis]|uniref:Iron complex transport system substrate-binding protein n=1 Tax=Rudaeicoccus suwonensis TaxID=657409 RepID=A0A561E3B8_9MICO|nr:ABC transporter substrate-binding protein [Rudaeicoccus suwonensis]TWE10090.1 iron complex transport system substrate-binding protein [Rudaeicoccus suwonensis]
MPITRPRIVSLLPSATEILFAIGAGDDVVGVTFECDEPAHARSTAKVVSTSALPEKLAPAEIDAFVSARVAAGEDLYHLDSGALASLDATLVVTQDLCAVCAVDVSVVNDALEYLQCRAEVLTTDPHTLEQVWESIVAIGTSTGHVASAEALAQSLRDRIAHVCREVSSSTPVRCAVLEWTDPPFSPGHWVPEMIERAGGISVLGESGAKSRRLNWSEVAECDASVVVVAPCGYGLAQSAELAKEVVASGVIDDGIPIWAVDANASFARPGPRLADGVEALSRILHPGLGEPDPTMAARIR